MKNSSCDALLVMVHGSPRPESNRDMFAVVDEVRRRGVYPVVEVGFLQCNEPTIPAAIARCVEQGATRVVAVPYFLHSGTHVADDLPTALEEAQEQYGHVEFLMGDFLGHDDAIADVIRDRTVEAGR
ncbi:MAG TPA: CbiX/SirB N-terminal domain-containing protein [Abditibacteriaceae bacterium]|jgi:sirohydrochlorin cobaltochelatase